MTGFRLLYRQGSFAFTEVCPTREEAISRALSVKARCGVWDVQIEDASGRAAARAVGWKALAVLPLPMEPGIV